MINHSLIKIFSLLLGQKGWISAKDSLPRHRDWLNKYGETPLGVARPCSTEEVSKIIILCNEHNVHIVPQGGNTSLVGGSVLGSKGGVILSLERMNSISCLEEASGTVSVEAGVILEHLHQFLQGTNSIFPMHLGSEGSAQIGGLVATNAGGSHAFRFGIMQDLVMGLEVVLPDGAVWDGMRAVQKDNTGYQLRKLFCGSEGTLGVVTKAVLKLAPKTRQQFTAFLAIRDASGLIELGQKLRAEAGEFLTAMEFFSDTGLVIALENLPDLVFPLQNRASFYLLLEVGSGSTQVPLDSILTEIMQWGMDVGIVEDGAVAQSETQRTAFWRMREEQPEGQRRLGMQLKHDISIPPGLLPEFLEIADRHCNEVLNEVRINPFGHLGDGNIHYNLSPPLGQQDFSNLDQKIGARLYKLASMMKGSFAAEHGIGKIKVALADELRSSVERDLMRSIKRTIDPNNIVNPDVLVSFK